MATDLAGNSNAAADQLSITVDTTAPTPAIATTAADPTNLESIPFTVNFGESMTSGEFVAAEIMLSSGTVTGFATSDDQEFAFNVIEADEGVLTVDVPASVATNLAGNSNAAADQLSITVDRTAPTLNPVTISSNNANSTLAASGDTVTLSFTASKSITDVEVTIGNVAATVSGSGTSWDATRTLDGTEPQGALSFTINFDDLAGNPGVQVSATTDSSAVTITVLDTDDALLTFPGSPPGSSGSGGGGGGGGSGRGNTGVSVSGDDSKLLDDVKLYSVSWDCVNGLVRIVAGPDASGLHATVRTTAYGLTGATHASDEMLEGRKVFTSSIQPNESYLGVQLTDISGRTLQIRSESITITECIGEKTFDVYQPESTSAIIEEAAAKAREDTITGQRTIFDSPLHQLKIGIPADQVQCNEGLVLVLKPSMEESACVTESTAPKLVLRGWHDVS